MKRFLEELQKKQSPHEKEELYSFFLRQTPFAIQGNIALFVITLLATPHSLRPFLTYWGVVLGILIFGRYLIYRVDSKEPRIILNYPYLPFILTNGTACCWGILPWILNWDPSDPSLLFIPFLLSGLAAGGVIISVASIITCILYPVIILSLGILPLSLIAINPDNSLFFMTLIYMSFLVRIGIMFNTILRNNFVSKYEVQELNTSLQKKGEELQAQNDMLTIMSQKTNAASRAKSEFLARMSHEIRTPLNAIIGMSTVGIEDGTVDGMKESFDLVQRSADHLLSLVNDILDFSKIESGTFSIHKTSFDLNHEISSIASIIKHQAHARDLWFSVNIADNVPTQVISDNLRIRQILINFLGNACKFTPSGGSISLNVSSEHSEKYSGKVLKFTVTDNGQGIKEEDQKKIFESFVQVSQNLDSLNAGSGLGLAISDRLAKLLGGEIVLKSSLGKGSAFTLVLPLVEDIALMNLQSHEMDTQMQVNVVPLEILVAEDNQINQKLIDKLLTKDGHKVTLTNNGKEVLDVLKNQSFDVILMDCSMPILDGYAASKEIRASGSTVPIIALTAHALAGAREECIASGMNEYLTKPIDRSRLRRLLARVAIGKSSASK